MLRNIADKRGCRNAEVVLGKNEDLKETVGEKKYFWESLANKQ